MTAAVYAPPVRARPTLTRVIIAASLGNGLEWFDFLLYGYFALTISLPSSLCGSAGIRDNIGSGAGGRIRDEDR